MGIAISKILAKPLLRLLIFLLMFGLFYVILNHTGLDFDFILILSVLIPSILIESLRIGSSWNLFGLNFDRWMLQDILIGLALAGLGVILIGVIYYLFGGLVYSPNKFYNTFLFRLLISAFCLAAFEEFIFRGVAFQAFVQTIGKTGGAIFGSLLFALAHLHTNNINIMAFINIFLAGCLLSVMYLQTLSLWMPIFWHFGWNVFESIFLGSNVSGYDWGIGLMKINTVRGPSIIFGGSYGIEGSIFTGIILIISIGIALKAGEVSPFLSSKIFKRNFEESKLLDKSEVS